MWLRERKCRFNHQSALSPNQSQLFGLVPPQAESGNDGSLHLLGPHTNTLLWSSSCADRCPPVYSAEGDGSCQGAPQVALFPDLSSIFIFVLASGVGAERGSEYCMSSESWPLPVVLAVGMTVTVVVFISLPSSSAR